MSTQSALQIRPKSTSVLSVATRKKVVRQRTSTGCNTCRIRRIKCDEAEPSCGQCLRGRRKCDGYPHKKSLVPSLPLRNPTDYSVLLKTDQERRCFEYFYIRTIPNLSGSFASPFWTHLLLLATHHEPAIQHAALALGALHECFEHGVPGEVDERLEFSVKEYVKAISLLTKPGEQGKQAADVALMTCVLFVCFETLRGHHNTALSHINGGIKIVTELQSQSHLSSTTLTPPQTPYVPLPLLNEIFARLDIQASQLDLTRRRHLQPSSLQGKPTLESQNPHSFAPMPLSFPSLASARTALDSIRTQTDTLVHTLPFFPPTPQAMSSFPPAVVATTRLSLDLIFSAASLRLKQWSLALSSFLNHNHHCLTDIDRRAVKILKIHRIVHGIQLSVPLFRVAVDLTAWDEYLPEYTAIVSQVGGILNDEIINLEERNKPRFTLDTEIIMPLVTVAVTCRDGHLRRRAIELLRKGHRQEGVWNSFLTARLAERIMEIEEGGLGIEGVPRSEDVPGWNRLVGMQIEWDSERRRARLLYIQNQMEGGVRMVEEWVEWPGLGK